MSKFLRYLAWTLVIVGVLIGIARLTVIRWWRVPLGDPYLEASIAPTLRGGDLVILWRATEPKEGDLVLCPEPKAAGREVIGRVFAHGGDHITLGNSILVNRLKFETESGCDAFKVNDPSNGQELEQHCRLEIVGKRRHPRGERDSSLPAPREGEVDVPPSSFFLVSDNRQFPYDSRDFGPVERTTCVETVIFRLMSKDGFFDVRNRLTLIR